ncbi:MAG: hypothetical protein ACOZNI_20090 [Myxococcota bacterium]
MYLSLPVKYGSQRVTTRVHATAWYNRVRRLFMSRRSADLTTPGDETPPPAEILPAAVADDVLDEVTASLNELARASAFDFARAAGLLIVEKFYAGDLNAWRSRGQKDASFRKLAERAEAGLLHVSAPVLYRSVAIYELEQRLGVSMWKHLTVSHLRAVLGLPEEKQRKLLTDAEAKQLTVADLERAAAKVRKKEADGRGRRPDPGFVKGIRRLGKLLQDPETWFGELEKANDLEDEEVAALRTTLQQMRERCEELEHRLATCGGESRKQAG